MILRIIDKSTHMFKRDDYTFNKENEIALHVSPSEGLYHPKWNGEEWVEGLSSDEIVELNNKYLQNPSVETRLVDIENTLLNILFTV